jgi:UDP-N-acetylmuramoylalanine--D-glutamate ligase
MELEKKNVLVVGMAKTGISCARFLLDRGARVIISDAHQAAELPAEIRELTGKGVVLETGGHELTSFISAELIVVSPGVPLEIAPLQAAQQRGIEIISEIELTYRFLKTPLIAITGTNGKTTTTSLIGEMFRNAGKRVFVGGNIGTPLIDYVAGPQEDDFVIAEISSFQLEAITSFRPAVSVMLNITEDHLDRYRSFADYIAAKNRIFMNQGPEDRAILNADDPQVMVLAQSVRAQKLFFSTRGDVAAGAFYNGDLHLRYRGAEARFIIRDALLQGIHNIENMMAVACVGVVCALPEHIIQQSLTGFAGLKHRMEFAGEIGGVSFYNDSKATNVGAVVKSLESLAPPLILIAGGKDKGGSYEPLRELVRSRVKALILLGEARERIYAELGNEVETVLTASMEEAVQAAFARATPGDTVLFSPACSSFDMFTSYAHRGECFKELVKKLRA